MLLYLIYTEFIKYKRTAVLWMIGIGGFITAGTGYLLVSSGNHITGWDIYSVTALNCINLLSILMTAVISGYVVINEYHGETVSNLFTYPVSRIKVFLIKFLIIFVFVMGLFIVFLVSAIFFGTFYTGELPSAPQMLKLVVLCFISAIMNFILAPVTVFIGLVIKGTATYLFVGMGYFIIYISLINSNYSYLIPTCVPNKIINSYYNSVHLTGSEVISIAIVSGITFFSAMISAGTYFLKNDCR